ncbi:GIY-YIG nuclease family protein [Trichormus variabilis]|uniref:Methionine sulfoxide reductase n=1 Tax=Trichormus variabilis SAG 1403-4b TaxID=447716 RepID=A0A433UNC6_ANAVA|nr:GIY-YIG nuclease family protein [Trichormus variabilis]MBD2626820.1 GIY-YIG nuclease family protein [Trichormus variabilis FACHB-164]RUS95322.1 methionine sulfoxide reductase [Trichormus variabilis SAG 1403-4b]
MYANKYGKTIKLFLMDSDPDGRIVCELSNWTGKAYRIPRGKVKDCSDREDLRSTAVYLLFGKPETSTDKAKVYIGEAENAYSRLVSHVSEKEFWNEAVVFISKDENLNKAHIKYLESRLFEIANTASRYDIENSNTPTKSSISESDQAEMEEFIEYIKILINTMGFKVFESIIKQEPFSDNDDEKLYIKAARGANAEGKRTSDGFVVFRNSEIAADTVKHYSERGLDKLRNELIENKIIVKSDDKLVFQSDYLFNSPSAAAKVIMGRSANGLLEWKDFFGKALGDIEKQEISTANKQIQPKG